MKQPLPRPLTNTERTINLSQLRLAQRGADGSKIGLDHLVGLGGDRVLETRLTQDFCYRVTFDELTELEVLLDHVSDFQDLVSIGTGRPAAFKSVSLRRPDVSMTLGGETHEKPIALFAPWQTARLDTTSRLHTQEMPFTLSDFGGAEGITRWLRAAARHRSALGRVMATRYAQQMYVTDQLMNIAAALEAYDRDKHGDDMHFVGRLKRSGFHAGEPFERLVGDVDEWAIRMKAARNEVAHHRAQLTSETAAYVFLSRTAYWLFVCCLLRDSDAPPTVYARIADNADYRWLGGQIAHVLGSTRPSST